MSEPYDSETSDIEAEGKFWREWNGDTNCLGTVAKCVVVLLLVTWGVLA